jgi:hypothetical protein
MQKPVDAPKESHTDVRLSTQFSEMAGALDELVRKTNYMIIDLEFIIEELIGDDRASRVRPYPEGASELLDAIKEKRLVRQVSDPSSAGRSQKNAK